MRQPRGEENLLHLSWGAQKFIYKPSSRILGFVISGLVFSLALIVFFSFVTEIDISAASDGQIVSSLGLREVRTTSNSILTRLEKKMGDKVEKNEVIGHLAIGQISEDEIKTIKIEFQNLISIISNNKSSALNIAIPQLDVSRMAQPEISQAYADAQRALASLNNAQNLKLNASSFEISPLQKRIISLEKQLDLLKKSKHKNLMGLQIDSIQDEISKLKIQISNQTNQSSSRLEESTHELIRALRQVTNRIDLLLEGHNIRSPVAGTVGKIYARPSSQLTQNQIIAMVVPSNTIMEVQLQVLSKDIGKVKIGQKVLFKVEAYPYQHFGLFEGEVIEVDRIKSDLPNSNDTYTVTCNIGSPKRAPASEIILVDGMKLEGSIIFERKKIVQILVTKVTGAVL